MRGFHSGGSRAERSGPLDAQGPPQHVGLQGAQDGAQSPRGSLGRSGPLDAQGAKPPEPPPGLTLDTPIEALKGIGAVRARLYARLGLKTISDLLFHFPSRHVTFPPPTPIGELFFQPEASVVGTLDRVEVETSREA